MCPSQGLEPVALSRFNVPTGRLCSTGSEAPPRYPASSLVCGPPTPLWLQPRLWFPLPSAYREANAFLHRPHVRSQNVRRVGGLRSGSSAAPAFLVDHQGSPRLLDRPLPPRRGRPPRRVRRPHRPLSVTTTAAFRNGESLGTRNNLVFEAAFPRLTGSPTYASTAMLPPPLQG